MSSDYLYGARAVSSAVFRQGLFLIRVIVPHHLVTSWVVLAPKICLRVDLGYSKPRGGAALGARCGVVLRRPEDGIDRFDISLPESGCKDTFPN